MSAALKRVGYLLLYTVMSPYLIGQHIWFERQHVGVWTATREACTIFREVLANIWHYDFS